MLGKNFLLFESYLFDFAKKLSKKYLGGCWQGVELQDGLFYMYPSSYEDDYIFEVNNPENWSKAVVDAQFFGFLVTTFALNALCCELYVDGKDNSCYVNMYHNLIQCFCDKLEEAEETEDELVKILRPTFFKLID